MGARIVSTPSKRLRNGDYEHVQLTGKRGDTGGSGYISAHIGTLWLPRTKDMADNGRHRTCNQ